MLRLELLNDVGVNSNQITPVKKSSSLLQYLWLLPCLLAPVSPWFVMVGVCSYVIALWIPSLQKRFQAEAFDKEFPEFLVYFRIASGSTDPYQAIAVAQSMVSNPRLKEKAGELVRSLMLGVVSEIDTEGTSPGYANFISLLSNHQQLGIGLTDTVEKLTSLTEERYFLRIRSQLKARPVTHTWIRLFTTLGLLIYMYYPLLVTMFQNFAR